MERHRRRNIPSGIGDRSAEIISPSDHRRMRNRPRDVYCGAVGWIDADRQAAELAVAIRTFWIRDGVLRFGTGAGITWGSDPHGEWQETELKARNFCDIASRPVPAHRGVPMMQPVTG